jgi:hypothetical protein
VDRLISSGIIQTDLNATHPNDVYAHGVPRGERVIRTSSLQEDLSHKCTKVIRSCQSCQDEETAMIERKLGSDNGYEISDDKPYSADNIGAGRSPLDEPARTDVESHFGFDLSELTIHANERAAKPALGVSTLSYTEGNEGEGVPAPYTSGTINGGNMQAVELMREVQQTSSVSQGDQIAAIFDPFAEIFDPILGAVGGAMATLCAHPVNWTHSNPKDFGPDGIAIPSIRWDSSTGKLADLSDCDIQEVVNYLPIPNPPFTWNPPNPTILGSAATGGVGHDIHSYPPGLKHGITNQRIPGTMISNQVYQYKCTGPGCSSNWTDFPGQTYSITREVFQRFIYPNPWRYKITKQGTAPCNTFNYSREVEIPEP